MARDFATKFYHSKAWALARAGYMNKVSGLCEDCLALGLITPAEIVHHKVNLSPENIDDVEVALSYDNLKAVCRLCHAKEHEAIYKARKGASRYEIDDDGSIIF